MDNKHQVYSDSKRISIDVEYVYMTIPADYICVYHKILILLTEYGIDMLKSCTAACDNKNRKIIDCFNMFNAAVAAKQLGQTKEAETIIKYIKAQLDTVYKAEIPCPQAMYSISEDGRLKALVTCTEPPVFEVDETTGKLMASKSIDVNIYGEEL